MTREEKQKAIDALKISAPIMVVTQEEFNDYIQTLNKVMDWLEQEPKWIPVSKRLPNSEYGESDSVLVCFENETQDVLYFDGSNWCYPTGETYISVNHKNDWHNKVTAWMPLPKSYEPQESEDKNGNNSK